jgi:hypothetical protein
MTGPATLPEGHDSDKTEKRAAPGIRTRRLLEALRAALRLPGDSTGRTAARKSPTHPGPPMARPDGIRRWVNQRTP